MGFKDFNDLNSAMLAKQAWRVLKNPNALWVTVLKNCYFPDSNFMQVERKRNDSLAWASLLHGRDILRSAGRWVVGDGASINIETDNWLVSGTKARLGNGGGATWVRELIDQNSRGWDVRKVRDLIDHSFVLQVLQTPMRWTDGEDSLIWPHTKTGEYSVKSGYHIIRRMKQPEDSTASSSSRIDKRVWKVIWQINILQKIKIFLWKAVQNIIPVRENLAKRRVVNSGLCPLCEQGNETMEHALLLCQWTRPIWFGSQIQCVPDPMRITSLANWFLEKIDSFQGSKEYTTFAIIYLVCTL